MKRRNRGTLSLLVLLLVSTGLMTIAGVAAKGRLDDFAGEPAVAVPFLMLARGPESDLNLPETGTPGETLPPETEPSEPHGPKETLPMHPEETEPAETAPLPVYGVDERYFDDALFIGDSRMLGLGQYAPLGEATYFADVGLTVFGLFSQEIDVENYGKVTLEELLTVKKYGKIYLMLGLNEAGYPVERLSERYESCVTRLRELQPGADVYAIQLFGVSQGMARQTKHLRPAHLDAVNEEIAAICERTGIVCLDPRAVMEDDEGYLQEDFSWDGVHPYAKYYPLLAQWLCDTAG